MLHGLYRKHTSLRKSGVCVVRKLGWEMYRARAGESVVSKCPPCVILASHRQTVKQEARIALAPVSSLEVLIDERAGGHFLVRDS